MILRKNKIFSTTTEMQNETAWKWEKIISNERLCG